MPALLESLEAESSISIDMSVTFVLAFFRLDNDVSLQPRFPDKAYTSLLIQTSLLGSSKGFTRKSQ